MPHLLDETSFYEPCAGNGYLTAALEEHGHKCWYATDIQGPDGMDAFNIKQNPADCFITNPPWTREILHPLIVHLSRIKPTWLLYDADWAHTKQAIPYLKRCQKIVSVGRVKWIEGSKHTGKDNCCWFLFGNSMTETKFYGR